MNGQNQNRDELCQLNVRTMPPELRQQFKEWCGGRGYSMERAVVALIRLAIADDMKLTDAEDLRISSDSN